MPSGSPAKTYLTMLWVAALVFALDQVTKQLALDRLADEPVHLIEGAVSLRLTFNPGGAFGILQGVPEFFLVATVVVVVAIVIWARHLDSTGLAAALGLVLGGGAGNLYDRVGRDLGGQVVDFIDLHVWPVFNLADSAIVTGVILVMLLGRRTERRDRDDVEAVEDERVGHERERAE